MRWKREEHVGTADFKRWARESRQLNWSSWGRRLAGHTKLYVGLTAGTAAIVVALTTGSSGAPRPGSGQAAADPGGPSTSAAPAPDDVGADGNVLIHDDPPDADALASGAELAGGEVPEMVLAAYRKAAAELEAAQPQCRLPVELLAAVGKVESNHADGGNVNDAGTTRSAILGPVLDGSGGYAAIADTDSGRYDGDDRWDRAVGPMQFIPGTWVRWAFDGNSDGVRNPHNVFDASLASGWYLCAGGRDLREERELRAAIFSYNRSDEYVDLVLAWMRAYGHGIEVSADPPRRETDDDDSADLADGGQGRDVRNPSTGTRTPTTTTAPPSATPPGTRPPGTSSPRPPETSPPDDPGPSPSPGPDPGDPDDPGDGGSGGLLCVVDETVDLITDIVEDLLDGGGDGGDEDCAEPGT